MPSCLETVLATVLREAVERIARKVASGKRLTDSEVMVLILDHMSKRIEEKFTSLEKRMDERFQEPQGLCGRQAWGDE